MRSMGHSEYLARFNSAYNSFDTVEALEAGRQIVEDGHPLTVHQAMAIVMMLARDGDSRFEGAGRRWLQRLLAEGHPPATMAVAASCVTGLAAGGEAELRCERALVALMGHPGDGARRKSP
jgi:hypothetical protein